MACVHELISFSQTILLLITSLLSTKILNFICKNYYKTILILRDLHVHYNETQIFYIEFIKINMNKFCL